MAFREVRVHEVREVLRHWLADEVGLRIIAERSGVDRKTARRYVEAAVAAGLVRDGERQQLTDELIGAVIAAVRPVRQQGHGATWESLLPLEQQIRDWIANGELQLTNITASLPAGGWWCRIARCTGSPQSGAGSGAGRRPCVSPMASPAWSASWTLAASA